MQAGGGYTEGGESDETGEMYGSERSTDQHLEDMCDTLIVLFRLPITLLRKK